MNIICTVATRSLSSSWREMKQQNQLKRKSINRMLIAVKCHANSVHHVSNQQSVVVCKMYALSHFWTCSLPPAIVD